MMKIRRPTKRFPVFSWVVETSASLCKLFPRRTNALAQPLLFRARTRDNAHRGKKIKTRRSYKKQDRRTLRPRQLGRQARHAAACYAPCVFLLHSQRTRAFAAAEKATRLAPQPPLTAARGVHERTTPPAYRYTPAREKKNTPPRAPLPLSNTPACYSRPFSQDEETTRFTTYKIRNVTNSLPKPNRTEPNRTVPN